ncbi:MAG: hypothetical protein U5K69_21600 [Balneolaceae bacterium]|nr:hypothetical protein [Balneolaceae bacterium]
MAVLAFTSNCFEKGEQLSRRRVARLMRKEGIQSQIRPKWVTTTDSRHTLPVAPNRLDQDFSAGRLGQVWVSDITYIPSNQGLAVSDDHHGSG